MEKTYATVTTAANAMEPQTGEDVKKGFIFVPSVSVSIPSKTMKVQLD